MLYRLFVNAAHSEDVPQATITTVPTILKMLDFQSISSKIISTIPYLCIDIYIYLVVEHPF